MSSDRPASTLEADTPVQLDEALLEERLRAERFRQYLRRQRLASASGALPSAYLAWLLADQVAHSALLAWWGLLLAADAAGLLHAHGCLQQDSGPAQRVRQRWRQIALQTSAGVAWSLAFMWVGSVSPQATISVIAVLVPVYSIGVLGMLIYPSAVLCFSLGMWSWPLWHLLGSSDPSVKSLGPGVLVLVVSMNFFLWEASRDLREGLARRLRSDALADALGQATRRIHRLATRDELTSCLNRREGMARLRRRLSQDSQAHCVVMLDIDHFKQVNDLHGHPAGDAVLREVSARLRAELRDDDPLVRMGGEEFLVLLPTRVRPPEVAERLRRAVADRPVLIGSQALAVTVSIGWTSCWPGEAAENAIARADKALYQAKHGGRNRVQHAEERMAG